MDISGLMDASLNAAIKALVMGTSASSLARARERAFVRRLINQLQLNFDDDDHRIFASSQRGNRSDFGSNQMLYDIAVCRIGEGVTDSRKAESFRYVAKALWQIEIDFSREWKPALYAINRLICGAAVTKLLIACLDPRDQERYLNTLLKPAACAGALYLALIPHPTTWDEADDTPTVWRLTEGKWERQR